MIASSDLGLAIVCSFGIESNVIVVVPVVIGFGGERAGSSKEYFADRYTLFLLLMLVLV